MGIYIYSILLVHIYGECQAIEVKQNGNIGAIPPVSVTPILQMASTLVFEKFQLKYYVHDCLKCERNVSQLFQLLVEPVLT